MRLNAIIYRRSAWIIIVANSWSWPRQTELLTVSWNTIQCCQHNFLSLKRLTIQLMVDGVSSVTGQIALLLVEEEPRSWPEPATTPHLRTVELNAWEKAVRLKIAMFRTAQVIFSCWRYGMYICGHRKWLHKHGRVLYPANLETLIRREYVWTQGDLPLCFVNFLVFISSLPKKFFQTLTNVCLTLAEVCWSSHEFCELRLNSGG